MNKRTILGLLLAVGAALVMWLAQGDGARSGPDDTIAVPDGSVTTAVDSMPRDSSPSPITLPSGDPSLTDPATTSTSEITVETVVPDTSVLDTEAPSTDGPDVDGGLESIDAEALPSQAVETLALIESGGPFPYDQDDAVFQNREGLLPDSELGYYREYTVETPGSDDRGARRIVTGEDGEIYYTDDHYESFWRVVQ